MIEQRIGYAALALVLAGLEQRAEKHAAEQERARV
jgi:hypothetical protein